MRRIVLDSGAVTFLSGKSPRVRDVLTHLQPAAPPLVPTMVVVECVGGQPADAATNRFLKGCRLVDTVPVEVARRAGLLRRLAGRGSAVDALVVVLAEGGIVVTGDKKDIAALAAHANDVTVVAI